MSAETPYDMCQCGWTRVQHCATPPHRCTDRGCSCAAFTFSADRHGYQTSIRSPADMRGAFTLPTGGLLPAKAAPGWAVGKRTPYPDPADHG